MEIPWFAWLIDKAVLDPFFSYLASTEATEALSWISPDPRLGSPPLKYTVILLTVEFLVIFEVDVNEAPEYEADTDASSLKSDELKSENL